MKYTQFIESVKKLPKPFKKGNLSVVYLDLFKTEIELNYLPTLEIGIQLKVNITYCDKKIFIQVFEKRNNQFFRVENKLKTSWLNFLTNQINEGASNCKKNNDQSANL